MHNNVTYRNDLHLGITDNWTYDAQDRVYSNTIGLVDATCHGRNNPDLTGTRAFRYDKLGNIIAKTGVGAYTYSKANAGPHAVTKAGSLNYQYDGVGNLLRTVRDGSSASERALTWTEFNKPASITRNGNKVEFFYDANHNRYLKKSSDGSETFYFGKTYERIKASNGEIQHKHFVYADGKLIALNTQIRDAAKKLKNKQVRYLHYDALNSVDMITDGYGNVVERRSYDTWGKQRAISWRSNDPAEVIQSAITNRGYTGHEEITEVNLIHMNGRVYDQELGRFLSADPLVQSPYMTNSFNRYSYVMNNPLKYTDPTGYWWESWSDFKSDVSDFVDSILSGGNDRNGSDPTVRNTDSDDSSPNTQSNKKAAVSGEVIEEQDSSLLENDQVVAIVLAKAEMNGNLQQAIQGLNLSEERLNELEPLIDNFRSGITVVSSVSIVAVRTGGLTQCFVEGTLVHTKEGLKPIEDIDVGDLVESKDDVTGEIAWKPVTQLFRNNDKSILNITIINLAGDQEVLGVTAEHPFWVEGYGWVNAGDLQVGQTLSTVRSELLTVSSIVIDNQLHDTYNFEVADYHTYFVGGKGIWVHNQCVTGKVRPGQTGTYGDLRAQKRTYGETEALDMDHQPSFAAQVSARESALGRTLTRDERSALKANTPAVASPRKVHQKTSPTYGGRNNPRRIAEDAADLEAAAARDRAIFDEAMRNR